MRMKVFAKIIPFCICGILLTAGCASTEMLYVPLTHQPAANCPAKYEEKGVLGSLTVFDTRTDEDLIPYRKKRSLVLTSHTRPSMVDFTRDIILQELQQSGLMKTAAALDTVEVLHNKEGRILQGRKLSFVLPEGAKPEERYDLLVEVKSTAILVKSSLWNNLFLYPSAILQGAGAGMIPYYLDEGLIVWGAGIGINILGRLIVSETYFSVIRLDFELLRGNEPVFRDQVVISRKTHKSQSSSYKSFMKKGGLLLDQELTKAIREMLLKLDANL